MGVAPGLRLKCSNAARQLLGTGMPIQVAFSFVDFVSVGCAVILLRYGLGYQCFDLIEAISQCFSTDCCELREELATGVVTANVEASRHQNRPGIQPGFHRHDAHAGLGITGFDGTLHRCRAAPAREQRRVHVETAQCGYGEDIRRQNQPVGDHD